MFSTLRKFIAELSDRYYDNFKKKTHPNALRVLYVYQEQIPKTPERF